MPNIIYTMDAANMYCGSSPEDTNASLHLKLVEVKLPTLDEGFVDHRAAGAPVAIEINTIIARLECTFQILGVDPQIYELMLPMQDNETWFWVYGLIRERVSGEQSQAAAVMKGRLARVDPQVYRRNDTLHTNFSIRGITQYDFSVAGVPIYAWDFFANRFQIGTENVMALPNQLLHVPNIAPQVPPAGPIVGTIVTP